MQIDSVSFIYLTTEEFFNNYQKDFEEFKNEYKHANIYDFFDDIKSNYKEFIDVENDFKTKYTFEVNKIIDWENLETKKDKITIQEIQKSLLKYEREELKGGIGLIFSYLPSEHYDIDFYFNISTALVIGEYFKYYDFGSDYDISFKFNDYKNLSFVAKKIFEFISEYKNDDNHNQNKEYNPKTWHKIIPFFVNGELNELQNAKHLATSMAREIIKKHQLDIKLKEIRPYLQCTFFNAGRNLENPKNLFSEKKLNEIYKYCTEKEIKITDKQVQNKILEYNIGN